MWAQIAMAAMQAVGSIMGGVSKMQADKQNALTAKAEGYQAVAIAGEEANRTRYQVAAQQSALKAAAGAQGTTFAGSPMEVYAQNALQGEQQAQDKIFGGALTMQAKKMEARNYRRQATGDLVGGIFGAFGSGAQGAAAAYGKGS